MKVRFGRSIVLVIIAALVVSVGQAAPAQDITKAQVKALIKKMKRGPRGPQGPQGPVGPQGPQGPAGNSTGVSVIPFKFLAIGNTGNTTIANFTNATAESGCNGGTFDQPRLRSTGENGAAEVLNLRTGTFSFDPDLDTGQAVVLLGGGGADDQYGLTYMSANGGQVVSAHYSAYDGAGISGQFDCAIFGTAQVG